MNAKCCQLWLVVIASLLNLTINTYVAEFTIWEKGNQRIYGLGDIHVRPWEPCYKIAFKIETEQKKAILNACNEQFKKSNEKTYFFIEYIDINQLPKIPELRKLAIIGSSRFIRSIYQESKTQKNTIMIYPCEKRIISRISSTFLNIGNQLMDQLEQAFKTKGITESLSEFENDLLEFFLKRNKIENLFAEIKKELTKKGIFPGNDKAHIRYYAWNIIDQLFLKLGLTVENFCQEYIKTIKKIKSSQKTVLQQALITSLLLTASLDMPQFAKRYIEKRDINQSSLSVWRACRSLKGPIEKIDAIWNKNLLDAYLVYLLGTLSDKKNIILLFGAAHLRSIAPTLEYLGYKKTIVQLTPEKYKPVDYDLLYTKLVEPH